VAGGIFKKVRILSINDYRRPRFLLQWESHTSVDLVTQTAHSRPPVARFMAMKMTLMRLGSTVHLTSRPGTEEASGEVVIDITHCTTKCR
jgi:hypothetical protein